MIINLHLLRVIRLRKRRVNDFSVFILGKDLITSVRYGSEGKWEADELRQVKLGKME